MNCGYPDCTGVHDNNRYSELCPRALSRKRARDRRYHAGAKGLVKRCRQHALLAAARLGELETEIEMFFVEGSNYDEK